MKKIIIGFLILCVAYTGASFYTGYQIKQSFDQSLTEFNNQLHLQGLDLHVISYKRGLFTTQLEMNLGPLIPSFSDADEKVGLNTETKIFHGPILFMYDFGLGNFSSKTLPIVKTKQSTFNKEYQKVFGDSLGKLFVSSYFGKSYKVQWKLDPITYTENGEKLSIEKSFLDLKGDLKTNQVQGVFEWGAMHFDLNKSEHLEFTTTPLKANFDFTKIEDAFTVGSFELALDKVDVQKNGVPFGVQNIKASTGSKVVGQGVDTHVKFSVGNFKGPIEIKNAYYNIDVNQISVKALKDLNEAQKKLVAEMPANDAQKAALQSIIQVLPEFLQKGLEFKIGVGANYKNDDYKVDLTTQYHPLEDGKTLADLTSQEDYLKLLDVDFHAKIPKSFEMAAALAPMVGTRVTENEKDYLIDAKMREGIFTVGTEVVDISQFVTQFVKGFSGAMNKDKAEQPQ